MDKCARCLTYPRHNKSYCKACASELGKYYYRRNREKHLEKNKNRKDRIKSWVRNYKSNLSCRKCGEHNPSVLQFHHLDPAHKDVSIFECVKRGWGIDRIKKEIAKCVVLCANCHFKVHAGEIKL